MDKMKKEQSLNHIQTGPGYPCCSHFESFVDLTRKCVYDKKEKTWFLLFGMRGAEWTVKIMYCPFCGGKLPVNDAPPPVDIGKRNSCGRYVEHII